MSLDETIIDKGATKATMNSSVISDLDRRFIVMILVDCFSVSIVNCDSIVCGRRSPVIGYRWLKANTAELYLIPLGVSGAKKALIHGRRGVDSSYFCVSTSLNLNMNCVCENQYF
jgi:hypothetical protein